MPDNKIELKFNPGQSCLINKGIYWLIVRRLAKDVTDTKYVDEVVPKSTGYKVSVYHIYVKDKTVTIREWRNLIAEKENPQAKSVIYKVSLLGFILILSSKTVSGYLNKIGITYKDGDNIEDLINRVFPDAEVVK